VAATVNFTLLHLFMTRVSGSLETRALCSTFVRCLLSAIPIGLIGWWCEPWLASLQHGPFLLRAVALLGVIAGALLLFFGASWMLRIEVVGEFLGIVKRKLGKRVA